MMPDPDLLLYMYIRKEAVLSSQIEGTQSSLSDLLMYEHKQAPGVPLDDVREVSRYVAAIQHGLARVEGGFPLSLRLIREIHEVLLAGGRGSEKSPGEFRRSQNWVGGSRPGNAAFVPPPPERLGECLGALERFLHGDPGPTPTLVKSALAHVQFETIHPFLDGNGRVGRLLIPLILCTEKVLQRPLLYLSLYFKQHREDYYRLLGRSAPLETGRAGSGSSHRRARDVPPGHRHRPGHPWHVRTGRVPDRNAGEAIRIGVEGVPTVQEPPPARCAGDGRGSRPGRAHRPQRAGAPDPPGDRSGAHRPRAAPRVLL